MEMPPKSSQAEEMGAAARKMAATVIPTAAGGTVLFDATAAAAVVVALEDHLLAPCFARVRLKEYMMSCAIHCLEGRGKGVLTTMRRPAVSLMWTAIIVNAKQVNSFSDNSLCRYF